MKNITKKEKPLLDQEIESVICYMSGLKPDTNEYAKSVENLETLYKAKALEPKTKISPDTKAIVFGNLIGIVLILGYERAGVITSKALGFIIKGRV